MAAKQKKIAVLFAGGSTVTVNNNKDINVVNEVADVPNWLSDLPEMSLLAECMPIFISGENSHFSTNTISAIVESIKKNSSKCDGFIVLSSAENLALIGIACEFLLSRIKKPIILTGSRFNPKRVAKEDIRKMVKRGFLGLRSNVINALQIAINNEFLSVAIMFGSRVIKPTHAEIAEASDINFFKSADNTYLGKVDFGVTLNKHAVSAKKKLPEGSLSDNVVIADYRNLLLSGDGFLFTSKKSKDVVLLIRIHGNSIVDKEAVNQWIKNYKAVVLHSEERSFGSDSAIRVSGLTWNSAIIKTLWAASIVKSDEQLKKMLKENFVNEFLA